MIIPLGHDQLTLRRWPIVSFTIIGLCVAAFVASAFGPQPDEKVAQERLRAALTYYLEHPHLTADPRLRGTLELAIAAQEPAAQDEIRERLNAPPEPPSPLDQNRQQRLDQLTDAWLAALQVGPLWDFGLVPARFSADRLLTHLFIHVGFLHLLFNMLFLYLSGPSLEDVWGRPIFAFFYLAAGVASAGCFVALYPDLSIPLVGASGAIAGLMGAFFVRFPRAEIRLFYVWMLRVGTTTIPAWVALLLWVCGELVSAYVMDRLAPGTGGAGVAHWGHVAGFAFGAAFAVGVRAVGLEERVDPGASREDRVWRQANRALERDDTDEAWRALREQMLHHPSDDDAALAYWNLAQQLGRSREAAPVLLRLIRRELERSAQESALRQWDELKEHVPDVVPPVDLAVKLAACIVARGCKHEAANLLRDALRRVDATTAPQVLADLALTAAVVDCALAAEAAARALTHPALPRDARVVLERLAGDTSNERAPAR
jgi:membrane associated rhomboid family serine protease